MTGMEVVRLSHDGREIQTVTARGDGGEERTFRARQFVSSAPLKDLARHLSPEPPPAAREAARRLRYRDFIVVSLVIDRAEMFPDNWIYVHSPKVQVGRIQNFKNWSPEMVPDLSTTCLGLEYFCFEEDPIWKRPDDEWIGLAAAELRAISLMRPADRVLDGSVVRMEKTYRCTSATPSKRTSGRSRSTSSGSGTCTAAAGTASTGTTIRTTRCTPPASPWRTCREPARHLGRERGARLPRARRAGRRLRFLLRVISSLGRDEPFPARFRRPISQEEVG